MMLRQKRPTPRARRTRSKKKELRTKEHAQPIAVHAARLPRTEMKQVLMQKAPLTSQCSKKLAANGIRAVRHVSKPRHNGHGVGSLALHFGNDGINSHRPTCEDLLRVLHVVQPRPLAKHLVGLAQLQPNADLGISNSAMEKKRPLRPTRSRPMQVQAAPFRGRRCAYNPQAQSRCESRARK